MGIEYARESVWLWLYGPEPGAVLKWDAQINGAELYASFYAWQERSRRWRIQKMMLQAGLRKYGIGYWRTGHGLCFSGVKLLPPPAPCPEAAAI